MKKNNFPLFLAFSFFLLISCESVSYIKNKKEETENVSQGTSNNTADNIIESAMKYEGTKYKFGGTSRRGMDCSGLVYTAFKQNDILLPRNASEQSKIGKKTTFKNLTKGDLIFFRTTRSRRISHVGIVIDNNKDNIQFIHASSHGVLVSSTNETYWNKAYASGTKINLPTLEATEPNLENQKEEIVYTVKKGDNLYTIAKAHQKTILEIKELNNLTSDNLKIGTSLLIANSTPKTYTVKNGDSLFIIARNYHTTIAAIKDANNLSSDKITIGMILEI